MDELLDQGAAREAVSIAMPIAAARLAWKAIGGQPVRLTLSDAAAIAAAACTAAAVRRASRRNKPCGAPLTKLPDAISYESIALTFDDGPNPETTPYLLDALSKGGAKATFFVLSERVARWPELTRRIAAEGHTIGAHGVGHDSMGKWNESQVKHALKMVLRELGPDLPAVRYFRPPYGDRSRCMQLALDRMGMTMALWSLDTKDYMRPPVDELVARVATRATHGDIVLMHDGQPSTVEALPTIVARLSRRGFHLVRL